MSFVQQLIEKSKVALLNATENPEFLEEDIKECSKSLKILNNELKVTNTVGRKNQAASAIALLTGFRIQMKMLRKIKINKKSVIHKYLDSAFKNQIKTLVIINITHTDPIKFLKDCLKIFRVQINKQRETENFLKVNAVFCGEFTITNAIEEEQIEFKYMNTKTHEIHRDTNIDEWFLNNINDVILKDLQEFQEKQSGWTISAIVNLVVNINKFTPQLGSSYVELPHKIKIKKACINVENNDNACFAWALMSALYPAGKHPQRVTKYSHYSTVFNLKGIQFPMTMNQIPRFEKQNNLSVNVYILKQTKSEDYITLPSYLTKNKRDKHVNLLLIQNVYDYVEEELTDDQREPIKYHYVWIKNLSRLLASQLGRRHDKKHFCDRCLHYFHSMDKLQKHGENCIKQNSCKIRLPKINKKTLEFTNFKNKLITPFIIYADLECILKKTNLNNQYQNHEPCSIGYYMKCSYDNQLSFYKSYRGEDCISWFNKELDSIATRLDEILSNPVAMDNLTDDQNYMFNMSSKCHICEKMISPKDIKVRDHCHFTGKFRGASHNFCNINYKDGHTVPIVFHNLSGYDSHFLIKNIALDMPGRIDLLPINKEKYISFTKHLDFHLTKFRFIDSLRFMDKSLNELSSYLTVFPILRSQFPIVSEDSFLLLTKKGIYPYDYVDDFTKFDEESLPTIDKFHNKLNDSNINEKQYEHAQNVWIKFNINNLGEYSDLYLKTDILLLAEVFEEFRLSCHKTYGLDPAHYYTIPGYTWDAMLKYTKRSLELLTDIDMLLFVERGIRGGLSQCTNRYSKANNKYTTDYDSNQDSTYLMYYDVNNQYGWAMSQYLPFGGFKWVQDMNFDVNKIADDSTKGYILEVDIDYPNELHDAHNDLPFCPEHQCSAGSKQVKLMATLYNKKNYVIHYRNLKLAIRYGLKISKIHQILEFNQSPWLKSYIDLNTKLRAQANNNFGKNLFKLMNNAVFGKTMENVRKYSVVKLVSKWLGRYGAEALISKPEFKCSTIFDENLVAIELNKTEIFFNKPIYIGMCVLDLAKTTLYNFHYGYMIPQFNQNCKICYTDTDSLIYHITYPDVYEMIKRDCNVHFDTSDYPENNIFGIPSVNKKIPGVMKDENNGAIMTEFVGLRSKMYALKIQGADNEKHRETKKAKGIKNQVVKCRITFDDYVDCLNNNRIKVVSQNLIQSKKHVVSSINQSKTALSPHDDKRYLISGEYNTLAWGHYKIMDTE